MIADPIPANLDEMRPAVNAYVDTFLISRFPRTPTLFEKVTGQNLSGVQWAGGPVRATFTEALQFTNRIGCSLPTECQWEYACRGGSRGPFIWGLALPSNEKLEKWLCLQLNEDFEKKCAKNGFGLYCLFSGEWCQDEWRAPQCKRANMW